jgi:hypothetical protein
MHDKMDHAKTTSFVFLHKRKQLVELMKLHVSITGILTHHHGDIRYIHYSLDLFAHNSNHITDSLVKLL